LQQQINICNDGKTLAVLTIYKIC